MMKGDDLPDDLPDDSPDGTCSWNLLITDLL